MNRNTWIIIIVAVIVIIGLIWIFNRGTPTTAPDFAEIRASIPAMPARKATTKDIASGS